jgi:hypothetical protein
MLALPTLLGLLAIGVLPGADTTTPAGASRGQLQAQLIGAEALIALAGIIPWIVLGILAQAYERPVQVVPPLPKRVGQRRRGRTEQSTPLEPGPIALWRWTKKAWPRPRDHTGRRLRHRERAAAHVPSSITPSPTGAGDPASDY